jgi:hypothetical protein
MSGNDDVAYLDDLAGQSGEEQSYSAAFAKLHFAAVADVDPFVTVSDPRGIFLLFFLFFFFFFFVKFPTYSISSVLFRDSLVQCSVSRPGAIAAVVSKFAPKLQLILSQFMGSQVF